MTIIEADIQEEKELNEVMNVTFDKIRKVGSMSGWQRILYNFIITRLGSNILLKAMNYIHDKSASIVPDGTDPEEIKATIKLALIDFVDSSM